MSRSSPFHNLKSMADLNLIQHGLLIVLGDECKESMLCQTILNQDHSIDRLLNYNGPQVIAIQGCQINWYDAGEQGLCINEP